MKIKKVDCLMFYTDNLDKWLDFYVNKLWLDLIWKKEDSAWLKLWDSEAELVLQTKLKNQEIDLMVDNVLESAKELEAKWAKIILKPFDIDIWKCCVLEDEWWNTFTILDNRNWKYQTDKDKNVIWLK